MRRLRRARPADEGGFTLVEIIVATVILLVGVLGVLALLDTANRNAHNTKVRDGATSLARELIEAARAVPYPDLTSSTVAPQIQAQPGLADSGGSGWQIQRRGITYTVTASVCSVDGATDGYGDHTGGNFCSDSATTGTADTNPDDYKRVAVNVSWNDVGQNVSVRQEAVINDPGSAFAPSVTVMTPSVTSPVTSSGTNSITFNPVKTSIRASSVKWYINNVQRGTATASGNDWQFTWDLTGIKDGTYQVRAQAFDRYGQTGAGYVYVMVINRYAPSTPTGVVGGRDSLWGANFVDIEWSPNPEPDVTGYKVYRVVGGVGNEANDTLICTTSVTDAHATSCSDSSAPTGNQRYYVVALAPSRTSSTGTEDSGVPSSLLNSDTSNIAPLAPATVTATALAGGGVSLSWTPSIDPNLTPIRYYRIYRGSAASPSTRFDITSTGTQTTWTDDSPNASSYTYWVTGVDDHLAESPLAPSGGITP